MITAGQTLSKLGAQQLNQGSRILNIFLICGYCLLVLRGLVWVVILRNIKLSVAYPAISITYVLILAISYYFFHEPVAAQKIVGALFIVAGVFCIGVGEFGNKNEIK